MTAVAPSVCSAVDGTSVSTSDATIPPSVPERERSYVDANEEEERSNTAFQVSHAEPSRQLDKALRDIEHKRQRIAELEAQLKLSEEQHAELALALRGAAGAAVEAEHRRADQTSVVRQQVAERMAEVQGAAEATIESEVARARAVHRELARSLVSTQGQAEQLNVKASELEMLLSQEREQRQKLEIENVRLSSLLAAHPRPAKEVDDRLEQFTEKLNMETSRRCSAEAKGKQLEKKVAELQSTILDCRAKIAETQAAAARSPEHDLVSGASTSRRLQEEVEHWRQLYADMERGHRGEVAQVQESVNRLERAFLRERSHRESLEDERTQLHEALQARLIHEFTLHKAIPGGRGVKVWKTPERSELRGWRIRDLNGMEGAYEVTQWRESACGAGS
ncbi:hypothetical protein CYMTET_51965, partial [Cymbomonas tetramitiformis]